MACLRVVHYIKMYTLALAALTALVSKPVLAQQFVQPPDSSLGNSQDQLLSWSVGDVFEAQWSCNWQNINLVLWNDATDANGGEWILRLLENQPNFNSSSFIVGTNIPLNNGSRFHLEVIQTDPNTGTENSSNLIDSESFNIVPGSSSASATLTVTEVVTSTDAHGSTVTSTHTGIATAAGVAASATATGKEASSQNNQASTAPATGMSQAAKTGLGVGLGLGIPLVVAATAAAWFFLFRKKRGGQRAKYLYSGLGTEAETGRQGPLPEDPRRKSDPYDFVHQGQTAPVEKDEDISRSHEPQELPS